MDCLCFKARYEVDEVRSQFMGKLVTENEEPDIDCAFYTFRKFDTWAKWCRKSPLRHDFFFFTLVSRPPFILE